MKQNPKFGSGSTIPRSGTVLSLRQVIEATTNDSSFAETTFTTFGRGRIQLTTAA